MIKQISILATALVMTGCYDSATVVDTGEEHANSLRMIEHANTQNATATVYPAGWDHQANAVVREVEVIRTVEVPVEVIKYVNVPAEVKTIEVIKEVVRTVEVPVEVIVYKDREVIVFRDHAGNKSTPAKAEQTEGEYFGINNLPLPLEGLAANNRYTPQGTSWMDSYSVTGDNGKEYCFIDSTFDHDAGGININLPEGGKITAQAFANQQDSHPYYRVRYDNDPIYNDVNCGNGPANDAGDEDTDQCPGRVDIGREGCGINGPQVTKEV